MAKGTPRIYATMDDRQENHQAIMVEVGGKISTQSVSIWIDPRSNLSYIHPKIEV